MPRIADVDGVAVCIYADDHPPPHVHARLAGEDMMVDIETGAILRGDLPPAKKRDVLSWVRVSTGELMRAWNAIQAGERPKGLK